MPRFNLSWLYVIIAMSFAILYFSNQEGGIDKQITYTEFKDMINKGYANKIIAYDDNTVEMYIKPEFVKDVFKNDYKKVGRNPALNVEIGSMESLDKFMEKAQEEGHFTGSISYEKKRDYFGALFWNIYNYISRKHGSPCSSNCTYCISVQNDRVLNHNGKFCLVFL